LRHSAPRKWIVLLEAASERGSTMDAGTFARLLSSWPGHLPTSLRSPDRYAVQVAVRAFDPPAALTAAIELWHHALRGARLEPWELARAEVVTPEEMERETLAAEWVVEGEEAPEHSSALSDPVAEELLRSAFHDPLTGLPNRELFLDALRCRNRSRPAGFPVSTVIVVSLDTFGEDRVSPLAGPDHLLCQVAQRLIGAVRENDVVARVAPADFALAVDLPSAADPDRLARRILDRARGAHDPNDHPISVTAGVSVPAAGLGADADDLLLGAQAALVAARRARGNRPGGSYAVGATSG
jgi:diguanylate cyclase (GGDEF)-like protein